MLNSLYAYDSREELDSTVKAPRVLNTRQISKQCLSELHPKSTFFLSINCKRTFIVDI